MATNRRAFLRASAGGFAASAALGLLPATVRRAMAIPAHKVTGTIMDVEHVVIFMQENRSFDHYFGAFNGVRGFGDPRPQRLPGGASVWRQPSAEHPDGFVQPFHGDSKTTNAYTVDGSDQGHQAATTIVNGGRYDNWGKSGELHKRMAYYKGADLPFYHALAGAFTICDAYHCSTLTQTYPNRLHLWSGCNGGGKVGGDPEMSNYGEDETPSADMAEDKVMARGPHEWTTYAERLQAAGVSWKVYQEYDNYGDNILSVFKPFRPCAKESPLYERGRSWVAEHKTGADRTRSDGEQLVEAFRADIAAGKLPQVSWIVTAADLSEHPSAEPSKGEHVCAGLIEALVDHPEVFAKTVFIVNYDEAGGFYDHMQPPMPPLSPEQGFSTVSTAGEAKDYGQAKVANTGIHPLGLGIRVPAIVVSPWSRGGYVCSEVFDHTSTLQFLEKRFGVREENISDWRRAVCGDLTSALDFATPNQDWANLSLPATADYMARVRQSAASPSLRIPEQQVLATQDGPQRAARPLPYVLRADARAAPGKVWIDLENAGGTGAVFQIFDNTDKAGPWRFTLGAGERYAAGHWNGAGELGAYDLTVHGPNGFYRRFAGDTARPQLAVAVSADRRGRLVVALNRAGPGYAIAELVMGAAYPLIEGEAKRRLTVRSKSTARAVWDLRGSDHWYDLTLTLVDDPSFVQRLAGHLETGRPSRTDPAIGVMRA